MQWRNGEEGPREPLSADVLSRLGSGQGAPYRRSLGARTPPLDATSSRVRPFAVAKTGSVCRRPIELLSRAAPRCDLGSRHELIPK